MTKAEQLRRAKFFTENKINAKKRTLFIYGEFIVVWTGTIGGEFVTFRHSTHPTKEAALEDARNFKARCKELIRNKQ